MKRKGDPMTKGERMQPGDPWPTPTKKEGGRGWGFLHANLDEVDELVAMVPPDYRLEAVCDTPGYPTVKRLKLWSDAIDGAGVLLVGTVSRRASDMVPTLTVTQWKRSEVKT